VVYFHVCSKGVLAVKLRRVPTGKANPMLRAAMLLEKMVSPRFLGVEKKIGGVTLWQDACKWTEVIGDMFSALVNVCPCSFRARPLTSICFLLTLPQEAFGSNTGT